MNKSTIETTWLTEGLTHLAEDIYSLDQNQYMTSSSHSNEKRVVSFLKNTETTNLLYDHNTKQRGGVYLFFRYLYEQAEKGLLPNAHSGKMLINLLSTSTHTGLENLFNSLYGIEATPSKFTSLISQFGISLYLSDQGISDSPYFNFDGINIRNIKLTNSFNFTSGPQCNEIKSIPFSHDISGTSLCFYEVSKSIFTDTDKEFLIELKHDINSKAFLFKL
ncbi:hypothetical protein BVY03_00010 [bacterium K02(2017)]|nr:hypothetical protein BVY03_00010 [bacterium K02(2017)]